MKSSEVNVEKKTICSRVKFRVENFPEDPSLFLLCKHPQTRNKSDASLICKYPQQEQETSRMYVILSVMSLTNHKSRHDRPYTDLLSGAKTP